MQHDIWFQHEKRARRTTVDNHPAQYLPTELYNPTQHATFEHNIMSNDETAATPRKRLISNPYKRKMTACRRHSSDLKDVSKGMGKDHTLKGCDDIYDDGLIDWSSVDVGVITSKARGSLQSDGDGFIPRSKDFVSEKVNEDDPYDSYGIDWSSIDIPDVSAKKMIDDTYRSKFRSSNSSVPTHINSHESNQITRLSSSQPHTHLPPGNDHFNSPSLTSKQQVVNSNLSSFSKPLPPCRVPNQQQVVRRDTKTEVNSVTTKGIYRSKYQNSEVTTKCRSLSVPRSPPVDNSLLSNQRKPCHLNENAESECQQSRSALPQNDCSEESNRKDISNHPSNGSFICNPYVSHIHKPSQRGYQISKKSSLSPSLETKFLNTSNQQNITKKTNLKSSFNANVASRSSVASSHLIEESISNKNSPYRQNTTKTEMSSNHPRSYNNFPTSNDIFRDNQSSTDADTIARKSPEINVYNYNDGSIDWNSIELPIVSSTNPCNNPSEAIEGHQQCNFTHTFDKAKDGIVNSSSTQCCSSGDTSHSSYHNDQPSSTSFPIVPKRSMTTLDSNNMISSTINHSKLPPELAYKPERVTAIEDGNRHDLIKAADISSSLDNGWKLLHHQKKAVIRAIRMRRLICAYDMGLGKTIIACVYAKAFKKTFPRTKVYVIAPVTLHSGWKKTAKEVTGLCLEEETDDPFDMAVCSWGKVPAPPSTSIERFVVICDEAHSIQSMESKRTRETLKLTLDNRCIGCLMLTGTPMKNGKPSNLFPLLKAVRHPFGDDQKVYETFFCAGQQKNFGRGTIWDASGSSNLPVLNYHVSSHVSYMTKEQCLKDLPAKTREYRDIPVNSRDNMKHIAALNELANAYEYVNRSGSDISSDVILGAFGKVRLVAAFAKVDATVDLACNFLKKEPAIVIFSNFVEVCKIIQQKLEGCGWSGELLTGQTPATKRQGLVDRFQGGISPVFVCTFGAGGVGLTLTAASTIILNDRPWTPGDALQAEDRVRRIGQTKPVLSVWMRSFEVDKQIDDLIEHKQNNYQSVVDRSHDIDGHNKSAPKISIINLIRSILPPLNHNALKGLPKSTD